MFLIFVAHANNENYLTAKISQTVVVLKGYRHLCGFLSLHTNIRTCMHVVCVYVAWYRDAFSIILNGDEDQVHVWDIL